MGRSAEIAWIIAEVEADHGLAPGSVKRIGTLRLDHRMRTGLAVRAVYRARAKVVCRLGEDLRLTSVAIARALNMSRDAVYQVQVRAGGRTAARCPVTPAGHRVRHCLMCGEAFPSRGIGERVCGACKQTTAWQDGNDDGYAIAPRGRR